MKQLELLSKLNAQMRAIQRMNDRLEVLGYSKRLMFPYAHSNAHKIEIANITLNNLKDKFNQLAKELHIHQFKIK